MSNHLIVEGHTDKIFIEALVEHLNSQNDEVICIDKYDPLGGLDEETGSSLRNSLQLLKDRWELGKPIQKVGIVLDNNGKWKKRIDLINNVVRTVFDTDEQIEKTGKSITISTTIDDDDTPYLDIACFLIGVDNKGELETILKEIKAQDSPYADCLESWRDCLNTHQKKITDKEFEKFWTHYYVRYDTCLSKEEKDAGKKCGMGEDSFKYIMQHKKEIWNFDHPVLDEFKSFLSLFKTLKVPEPE